VRSVHPGASTAEGIGDGALQEVRSAAGRCGCQMAGRSWLIDGFQKMIKPIFIIPDIP